MKFTFQFLIPEKHQRVKVVLVIFSILVVAIIVLRALTPETVQLPALPLSPKLATIPTSIVIEDISQPINTPTQLKYYQVERVPISTDSIVRYLELPNAAKNIWTSADGKRELLLNSDSLIYAFNNRSQNGEFDISAAQPVDLNKASQKASKWLETIGARDLTPVVGSTRWLSGDNSSSHFDDSEQGKGNIVVLTFSFTHDGYSFFQEDSSEYTANVYVDTTETIRKALFPGYTLSFTEKGKLESRNQKQALAHIDEAIVLSVSQNNIENVSIKDAKSLKILTTRLEYRFFDANSSAYPVYYFEASAKNNLGQDFGITFLIPAIPTTPKTN